MNPLDPFALDVATDAARDECDQAGIDAREFCEAIITSYLTRAAPAFRIAQHWFDLHRKVSMDRDYWQVRALNAELEHTTREAA